MTDAVLVLGASGFVGQCLVRALRLRGERVIAASRREMDHLEPGVEVHVRAFREAQDFLPILPRCRAVVHAASASTPGSSAGCPLAELDGNLRPTFALLQALQEFPAIPLLYISSGGTLYGRSANGPADESTPVYSPSYHGAGKVAAEHFIEAWCNQFNAAATVLRPSNLYGPGQRERAGFGIVPAALGKIVRNEALHVWGDGSAQRDYLYIDDFARLCMAVVDAGRHPGYRLFNACSGDSVCLDHLIAMIEKVTGKTLRRSYDASRRVDSPSVRMQAIRASQQYGWTSNVQLPEGLERTWRWFSTIPH